MVAEKTSPVALAEQVKLAIETKKLQEAYADLMQEVAIALPAEQLAQQKHRFEQLAQLADHYKQLTSRHAHMASSAVSSLVAFAKSQSDNYAQTAQVLANITSNVASMRQVS